MALNAVASCLYNTLLVIYCISAEFELGGASPAVLTLGPIGGWVGGVCVGGCEYLHCVSRHVEECSYSLVQLYTA